MFYQDQLCRLEPWTGPGGPWQIRVAISVFFLVWNFVAKQRTDKFKREKSIKKYQRNILNMDKCGAFGVVWSVKSILDVFLIQSYNNSLPPLQLFWVYNIYQFVFIIVNVFFVIWTINVSLQEMLPREPRKLYSTHFFITYPSNLEPRRLKEKTIETVPIHKHIYFPKTTKNSYTHKSTTMSHQDIVHEKNCLVIVGT